MSNAQEKKNRASPLDDLRPRAFRFVPPKATPLPDWITQSSSLQPQAAPDTASGRLKLPKPDDYWLTEAPPVEIGTDDLAINIALREIAADYGRNAPRSLSDAIRIRPSDILLAPVRGVKAIINLFRGSTHYELIPPPPAPKTAQEFLAWGNYHVDTQQYDRAMDAFTNAIKRIPENPASEKMRREKSEAYLFRGQAYQFSKQVDLALSDYTEAIALAPANPNAFVMRAEANELAGHDADAMQDYQKAVELGDETAAAELERVQRKLKAVDSIRTSLPMK
ncbi:MAG: tetratricopeptide repeat protein [Rhizobacter sp.]|nr:tetratricopeptide repeat protein [Chlorobiales bacterium]